MEDRRVPPLPHSWDEFMPEPLFPGGLVIKDHEVEVFLFWGAKLRAATPCTVVGCEQCDRADRFWWEWCNSLHGTNRVRLQRGMRLEGVPLPPHPGDDIPTG